jgi:ribosomal protein S1
MHLEDRRSGGDRRIELDELSAFLPASEVERRQVGGRRATDMTA